MEELVRITPNENGDQVVSAKELYLALGYDKSQWSRWIKANIIDNSFAMENVDYQTLDIMSNGNQTKDFALTIDFAKRISMMAKTDKGEQIRNYFIECEKAALAITSRLASPKELAQMVIDAENAKEEAERKLAIQQPRVDYVEQVLNSGSFRIVNEIAMDLGITNQKLNKILCEKGIQYKQNGRYMLFSQYRDKGYAKNHTDVKNGHSFTYLVWSEKGRAFIHSLLNPVMVQSISNKQQILNNLNPVRNGIGN